MLCLKSPLLSPKRREKMGIIRHDWTIEELQELYHRPLLELISQANILHGDFHNRSEVQVCSLISIKTGGCSEDCKYCPQSSRYQTVTKAQPLMQYDEVMIMAKRAVDQGATRICLGAAWREVRDSEQFERVLQMIRGITDLGVEVCCTLGMLTESQAMRLKEAGLFAYNHNLDSSEKFYKTIITTRSYQERLETLSLIEKTGISVCCGGILGMGEALLDRLELLQTLSRRNPHPESIPLNQLTPVAGTPLENQAQEVPTWEMARMVATTRIVFPKAMVRLSCGRLKMSWDQQFLFFLAGANSIHSGEKLLTTPNIHFNEDEEMLKLFGLKKRAAFACSKN